MITVNGKPVAWKKSMTVSSLLKTMKYTYPMIVVKIDSKVIEPDEYEKTLVPDGAEVEAIHLISGG
ncbi:MAG: sulfur carrier protein ThiS [Nanoarchaeota archaeon]|nr:sulfur carrier protein ThiS [Nanoarchaeota archaeon]